MTRRYGANPFASWRGTVFGNDDTGAVPDDVTIDRLPRSEAASAVNGWKFYLPLFATSLPSGRLVMRRKVDGKWEYRAPTPEEEADYVASEGW
jgi:hypothetical protein